ncbi:hypothetical protein ONZ45_g2675 [Pleurotus djamor]|nr:hypothetical protein ONZ45_g2675 [Pleurotus djamor]
MLSTPFCTVLLCFLLALSVKSVPAAPNLAAEDCIPPVCRPKWPQSGIESLEAKDAPPTTPSKYAIDYMPTWAARPEKVDAPPEAPRTRTSKYAIDYLPSWAISADAPVET